MQCGTFSRNDGRHVHICFPEYYTVQQSLQDETFQLPRTKKQKSKYFIPEGCYTYYFNVRKWENNRKVSISMQRKEEQNLINLQLERIAIQHMTAAMVCRLKCKKKWNWKEHRWCLCCNIFLVSWNWYPTSTTSTRKVKYFRQRDIRKATQSFMTKICWIWHLQHSNHSTFKFLSW